MDGTKTKNIILVCPTFFDYYKDIVFNFKKLGFNVFFYSDRPSEDFLTKSLLRINRNFLFFKRRRYYNLILKKHRNQLIDFFVMIDGQGFNKKFVKQIKKEHPESKTILYLWDSLANYPHFKKLFDSFDVCSSFEPEDCKKYNLKYVPTFFRDSYKNIKTSYNREPHYFASFIGTARPKKYHMVESLKKQLQSKNKKVFTYYYLPSRILFLLYKIFDKRFTHTSIKEYHFKALSNEDVIRIYEDSFSIIDSPPSGQKGVTVRCYESIALGKKIITNNAEGTKSNRYLNDNSIIFPFSEEQFDEFIKKPFTIENAYYDKYSVETFCKTLLSF